MQFVIKKSDIKDTYKLIVAALGHLTSYHVVGVGPVFEIMFGEDIVATAEIKGDEVVFYSHIETFAGLGFETLMEKQYATHDPDKLLWLVIYPWKGNWSCSGYLGALTKELALSRLSETSFALGAKLIAFRQLSWGITYVKTESVWKLGGTWPEIVLEREEVGEQVFNFETPKL